MTKIAYNDEYGGFCLSEAAMNYLKKRGRPNGYHSRHDSILIECIEVLGDAANGEYARLKITEINADKYIVNNYDGMETITTPDDIEWINIAQEGSGE